MPLTPVSILLVEDSDLDAELTLIELENSGLNLVAERVYGHAQARDALAASKFDLIICDYILPGSSGLEVLRIARELAVDTPFIFLSGISEHRTSEVNRLGATDFVLKHNLKGLSKTVRRALLEVRERERRQAAERALEESEVRARVAIEAALMGVWDINPHTYEMHFDERCKALYEMPPTSAMDLAFFLARCHVDDRPLLSARIDEALTSDARFQVEFRITLPGERMRWIRASGRSMVKDGLCVRFTGVLQDVDEQMHATQALEQMNDALGERVEQRTRERDRTWELSRELLGVMRFDMSPISFNPAWASTLGWTREQLSRLRLWELIHPEDLEATARETESIASGNISTRFVNRMRHANGDYRWLSWTIVPEDGLMYAAVRDITDERAVVDELAAANTLLREQIAERERAESALQQMQRLEVVGQLTAGVAHDFNNLLTVILASASFVLKDLQSGKLQRTQARMQNIIDAGERGAKLTSQLLSFSRRQRLQPAPVNLNTTIAGMRQLLTKALGSKVWLEIALAEDLASSLVDPTQTEMIILNLAINSRDAMPMGGAVTIRTANVIVEAPATRPENPEPGAYVLLSISDTGEGMSEEVIAKAFEPFFTTKEVGKGSGLGLAQVYGFAKQSGGGVAIQTQVGVGTTVNVYLPREALDSPVEEQGVEPSNPAGTLKARILLVDDDDDVRDVTATLLRDMGHRVRMASTGLAALESIDDQIDLVITDFAMPGMTGAELAKLMRQSRPELKFLFITGYADTDILGLNEAFVVQKPYQQDVLKRQIEKILTTVLE